MNTITLIVICAFGFVLTSMIAKLAIAITKNIQHGERQHQPRMTN